MRLTAMGALGLVACGPVEGPVLADGLCTSYSRSVQGDVVMEEWVDVLPGFLEVRKRTEMSSIEEGWMATNVVSTFRDGDGLPAQRRVHHRSRETDDVEELTVYEWDDQGRALRTVRVADSGTEEVSTFTYDAEGQLVREDVESLLRGNSWHEWVWDEAGRQTRFTTWQEGEAEPDYEVVWTHLCSAPCKDADVRSTMAGQPFLLFTERYRDGLLVERNYEDTVHAPYSTVTYRYDASERKVSERKVSERRTTLETWDYDPAGRLQRTRSGPDADGDHVLDSVDEERLWVWRCR